MFQEYENLPPNHAPTYSDVQMDPLLAAIGGDMKQYANAEDRARYPGHMMYPMSPEMGEMSEATNLHGLYPSGGGGGAGWGGDATGTGGGTGHSGYGYGGPYGSGAGGYDYHPAAPAHVPTGGSYSHHATAGSGYGGYAPPPPKYYSRPHPTVSTKGRGKKKHTASQSNASTMNALTLLAFFFFVNLLQNCLKENMEAINPTVMVMTSNMMRNRNTKLAEMNSREQSSSPASAFTSGANIVVRPETLVSAGSSSVVAGAPGLTGVTLQTSPYSDGGGGGVAASVSSAVNVGNNYAGSAGVTSSNNQINNNNNNNHGSGLNDNQRPAEPQYSYGTSTNGVNTGQQHYGGAAVNQNQHNNNMHSNNNNQAYGANNHGDSYHFSPTPTIITANRDPRPEFYDPPSQLYPNQTINSATSLNQQHYYQQQLQQQHQQHQQRPYPPEQFEEEEYEPQVPQQQPPSQIQQFQQQHEQHAHNPFQQQQHYHESRPNDNFSQQQQQPDHHEDYHEHHHQQQPAPPPSHDHFQHHYPAQHSQHQSSFHSHQQQENYGINRRPSSPNRGHSEASHPWSYSPATSPFRRGSSNSPLSSYTWSSDSLKSHVSGNNNFGDFDEDEERRYEDSFYTRSNRKL